jgi:hypothetical protein
MLALPIEETFGLKTTFQLLKRQLQSAPTFRLEMVQNKLVLTARLIDRESPPHDDVKAVFQTEPQAKSSGTKDHRSNLT